MSRDHVAMLNHRRALLSHRDVLSRISNHSSGHVFLYTHLGLRLSDIYYLALHSHHFLSRWEAAAL